jgi:hypothetical protein
MKSNEVKAAFEEVIEALSPDINRLLPEDGIRGLVKFYQMERIDGCDMENDGDMLLFQWGIYNFTGKNEFQINITRQLLLLEEDEPYQLSLTFYYDVNDDNSTIKAGNFWCNNVKDISGFLRMIDKNSTYQVLKDKKAAKVEMTYDQC